MPLDLERLSAADLDRLPRESTVFFFPVGALEDHGPHLPLGLDLAEADRLCRLLGEKLEKERVGWNAVIAPRAPLGIQATTQKIALISRAHVLRDWLVDATVALNRSGFRHFVCWTGTRTPRQLTAIEEAHQILLSKTGFSGVRRWLRKSQAPELVSVESALVNPSDLKLSPLWPDPLEHGGTRDTAVALALGQIDATTPLPPPVTRASKRSVRLHRRLRNRIEGYWGDPGKASPQMGEADLNAQIDAVYLQLKTVWQGANPQSLFRSRYAVFPPNRSFFVAWSLGVMLALILSAWMYFSFQLMTSTD